MLKKYGQTELASEAVNYVLEKLSEENWSKLKGFAGKSSPKTYMIKIISNLLNEFSRVRFGRPRMPVWVIKKGPTWQMIWEMAFKKRMKDHEVIDTLEADYSWETFSIANMLRTLRAKIPTCGIWYDEVSNCETLEKTLNESSETSLDQTEKEDLLGSLILVSALINDNVCSVELLDKFNLEIEDHERLLDAFTKFQSTLRLTDDEMLVIKAHYQDGLTLKRIAEVLEITIHKVTSMRNKALKNTRSALKNRRWS